MIEIDRDLWEFFTKECRRMKGCRSWMSSVLAINVRQGAVRRDTLECSDEVPG
jgi:hypothetical protein